MSDEKEQPKIIMFPKVKISGYATVTQKEEKKEGGDE